MNIIRINIKYVKKYNTILGVKCYNREGDHYKGDRNFQPYNGQSKNNPPRRKIWSDEVFSKFRERPFSHPVYENRGPALFPQDQPFPPGGPSVLSPPNNKVDASQIFNVGSSLNIGGNSQKVGNSQSSLGPFRGGTIGVGSVETVSPFQGELLGDTISSGFSPGSTGGFQEIFENGRPVEGTFSPSSPGGSFSGLSNQNGFSNQNFNSYPGQGFGLFHSKYHSALAKNPLFLVLKLLITEPGLWVTSPVLYHGLAHTGIVKPFPHGFGIYGFRFANNVPDSQPYGNGNIINDNP